MSDSSDRSSDGAPSEYETRLREVFSPERIQTDVQVSSLKRMIESMSGLFTKNNQHAIDKDTVFRALLERERLGSTCVGNGVALPHGRLNGLPNAVGAIMRMKTPLDMDASDEKPVFIVCGLLVPADCADAHIKILAKLARGFEEHNLHQRMMEAEDSEAIFVEIVKFDAELTRIGN